ncbi:MAG: hypothetical protein KC449_05260, partial [Anaerolineales bacterium]|nr:hypothetical protein [Anaerolineales bacterium]
DFESWIVELVADVQHAIWSHWMKYMFSCGDYNEDECWVMPAEKATRWERQMKTDYGNLTEREKASDREQAVKVLAAIEEHISKVATFHEAAVK